MSRYDGPTPYKPEPVPDRWHVMTPFKVKSLGPFFRAADHAGLDRLFKRNQEGYVFCVDPRPGDYRPELERLYELLQAHLPPREYALVRIEHFGGSEADDETANALHAEDHTRYEKVFADRIEPSVYSDDPFHRR